MSSALYDLFLEQSFALAKTLVIKSEASADAQNKELQARGFLVDPDRPETWRYYKHLAGEYHSVDTPMQVTSLDTLQTIDFTKENLLVHRATAKAYSYGTPYYHKLVTDFPLQEALILGIVNPVPIEQALKAADHTILWWDRALVEANETNLISGLETWIRAFFYRIHVKGYAVYQDLYEPARQALMFSKLPSVILRIRLENCHTRYTHSFHIWTYLAGKGKLDRYRELLTKEQALWLYRNINYINHHAGEAATFELLVENLLTKRGIPLAAYTLEHQTEHMVEELYPRNVFVAQPVNFPDSQNSLQRGVEEVLADELPLALENPRWFDHYLEQTEYEMSRNAISSVPTKVNESKAVDRSDSRAFRFQDILLNEWMHLSLKKRYNVMLSFQNPGSGEGFTLPARDSFVLYLYCWFRGQGKTLVHLPWLYAKHVRLLETPDLTDLRAVCSRRVVPDSILQAMYKDLPAIGVVVSTATFYDTCQEVYRSVLWQWDLATRQEHLLARGQVENVAHRFYGDVECDFGHDRLYTEWFRDRGLYMEDLSQKDYQKMALDILDQATGQDLARRFTMKEIHSAMLALTAQLSSYTIQFISTMSESPVRPLDAPLTRVGDIDGREHASAELKIPKAEFRSADSRERESGSLNALYGAIAAQGQVKERASLSLGLGIGFRGDGRGHARSRVPQAKIEWKIKDER